MGPLARVVRVSGAVALVALVAACPGTRYHSQRNAPGIVHLEAPPPRENGDPALYVAPEDPGEHELYLGPAVVLGPATGRNGDSQNTEFEANLQLRVAYQELETSHRSKDTTFLNRRAGWAMTLGWTPVQTDERADGSRAWKTGPTYVEIERYWFVFSAGLGAVAYSGPWDGGVQATLTAMPYGIRMRYLADGGFEVMGAFRLELPTAINWSR